LAVWRLSGLVLSRCFLAPLGKCSAVQAKCPLDLLENPDAKKLNYWLSRFIVEARRKDGDPYPARTLYLLLAGLLHYGRLSRSSALTSWIRTILVSMNYLTLVTPLHNRYARTVLVLQLNMQPLSLQRRKPCYWIRNYGPKALVRAVFFYAGKAFCLRGGAEQRSLKPSQFEHGYNPDRYTLTQRMAPRTIGVALGLFMTQTRSPLPTLLW